MFNPIWFNHKRKLNNDLTDEFDQCTEKDPIAADLWKYSEERKNFGDRFFVCYLILSAIVAFISLILIFVNVHVDFIFYAILGILGHLFVSFGVAHAVRNLCYGSALRIRGFSKLVNDTAIIKKLVYYNSLDDDDDDDEEYDDDDDEEYDDDDDDEDDEDDEYDDDGNDSFSSRLSGIGKVTNSNRKYSDE